MKLAFVGDVMIGRLVNEFLRGERSLVYPWGDSLGVLEEADVRFCNLECVISDKGEPWSMTPKVFHFRSDAKNVGVLKRGRIDCVSLANNHVLDYGYEAFGEMLDVLKKTHIYYAGAGEDRELARRAAVFEVRGCKIGFISLTDNEAEWEARDESSGVYYMPIMVEGKEFLELVELVRKTKEQVDILIVAAHWGSNWGYQPEKGHVEFARALIDNGVDVIFGHSCHVFRGIEVYKGCPIIYSAGDFIDDYAVDPEERNDQSFIFMVETEGKRIVGMKLYPTIIKDFQACRAKEEMAERIARKMERFCEEMGTVVRWNEELGYLEIGL